MSVWYIGKGDNPSISQTSDLKYLDTNCLQLIKS